MQAKAKLLCLAGVLVCAACSTPSPERQLLNEQARFDERARGYPDTESVDYRQAQQRRAQQESMRTGKPR